MTRQELIRYYKERLHITKTAYKNQRKAYKEQYGHDLDAFVLNAHERDCLILKETIMYLKRLTK